MQVGSKVVCINDTFASIVYEWYISLPKKGEIYYIRHVTLGCNLKAEPGEVSVCLKGLHNPKSNVPPFQERGFNSERFRELEPPKTLKEDEEEVLEEAEELVEVQ